MIAWRRPTRRQLSWAALFAAGACLAVSLVPISLLRWVDPPTTAFMYRRARAERDGERLCPEIHQRWVDWIEISPWVPVAVVAAEDQKFPHHSGFDVESIRDAFAQRQQGGRLRGASTISQQLAKNLLLWPGQNWTRKALEAYFTVLIETTLPKRRILEVYLNVAQFGPCTFGVAEASRRSFGIDASELGPTEAAILAAVLPSPTRMRASDPSEYVRGRVAWILDQLEMLGGLEYLSGL